MGNSLNGDTGHIEMLNAGGQVVDLVDYGPQLKDFSIGRKNGSWRLLASPTPHAENTAPMGLGNPAELRINEWMAEPLSGDDWFKDPRILLPSPWICPVFFLRMTLR